MSLWKRIVSSIVVICMLGSVTYAGSLDQTREYQNVFDNKDTLHIWYTDENLTDYISSLAVRFQQETDVRVIPVLQSGVEYLENIGEASLHTDTCPDLYIVSNDSIEKAALAGLAIPIEDETNLVNDSIFPESGIRAVTYRDHIMAYPYYFETSALLYNKTYLKKMTEDTIKAEDDSIEEDAVSALVGARMEELIPDTFDDLLNVADNYDAPEAVEAVFKWDVADIFYNYFFVGNYITVGGPNGDNTEEISIYNKDAIEALQVYQNLNQFFSIEAKDVAYNSVIQEFMEGKMVYTTATTDILKKLEQAKADGEFDFEYGLAMIPDLKEDMLTRSMSVTNGIVINGYSRQIENANRFARYLVSDNADSLYEQTGKIPVNKTVSHHEEGIQTFMEEYEYSVPLPKMLATSNFWVQLEIAFSQIWSGANVSATLKNLSEQIMTQVTGAPFEETLIELPKEEIEIEYLDEAAEIEAAKSAGD